MTKQEKMQRLKQKVQLRKNNQSLRHSPTKHDIYVVSKNTVDMMPYMFKAIKEDV